MAMTLTEFQSLADALRGEIRKVIAGQQELIDHLMIALFARGHCLLEGPPGTAKTLLAQCLSQVTTLDFGRIQFTPDLMPGDVLGVSLFNFQTNEFRLTRGPIFTDILLADEINRAPPKTQSALLQAMNERQVTIDDTTHDLGEQFFVIATQNPIEHEGTYPLPESQLDRFLMRLSVGYPGREAETQMLDAHGEGDRLDEIGPVATTAQVHAMINAVRTVEVAEPLQAYLVDLADATRRHGDLALGMSPRATLALQRAIRARAAANGRNFALPDDVKALAQPVLAHRLIATPEAQLRGTTAADALAEILAALPVPTGAMR